MSKERCVPRHRNAHLNGGQQHLSLRFTYVNDRAQQASERIQPATLIEIARSIMNRSIRPLGLQSGPRWQKGDVMFRKIAIALVATSVLAAPVLAQGTTLGDSKVSPTTPSTTSIVPKSEKAITKVTKHRMVLRHHRHGTKLAKYSKSRSPKLAKYAKSHGTKMVKTAKYGKYTHPMKHGRTASKFMSSARASAKPISSKALTKRSFSKPAAKRGLD
jgi:hypothetical protein